MGLVRQRHMSKNDQGSPQRAWVLGSSCAAKCQVFVFSTTGVGELRSLVNDEKDGILIRSMYMAYWTLAFSCHK